MKNRDVCNVSSSVYKKLPLALNKEIQAKRECNSGFILLENITLNIFVKIETQYFGFDHCNNLLDQEIKLRLHKALFSKELWDKPSDVLSGGERLRLYICRLMISNHVPDLFILDEPRNNLDLSSLEIFTSIIKIIKGL